MGGDKLRLIGPAPPMSGLPLRPARVDEPELLDQPGLDPALLAGNLADLRRVNRWLGGVRLTLAGLNRLTRDLRPGDELTVLDLATGGADIPAAVAAWAERRGFRPRVLATDLSAEILGLAECPDPSTLAFALADARRLPFADGSIDVVTCSLVLHHLKPEDAVAMLREMRRVARRGIVVNDLVRNWMGYLGAWLLAHLMTRNPLTRHDAPLSARRAYTRREMAALAAEAQLGPVGFTGFLGYRVAMVAGGQP